MPPSPEEAVFQEDPGVPVPDGRGHRAWQEGLPLVAGLMGVGLACARRHPLWGAAAAVMGLGCAAFFRDPEVIVDADELDVLSAATGTVMGVEEVDEPWWIQGRADRVSVFLSVLDVHVNRCPTAGRLVKVKKLPGSFRPAFSHSDENCRDLLAIDGPRSRLVVAQIAGVLARRSVQWLQVGDRFRAGDRFGMIRFGSRTDVYLPAGQSRILVKAGQRLVAGRSRIARYLH